MEIVSIYDEWLYSIQFDEEDLNEYVRVFQDSPVLKDNVFKKIDEVLCYLRVNGIADSDDI